MKPKRFHYPPRDPGYRLDVDDDLDYMVWLSDPPCAAWSSDGGYHGKWSDGATLEDAMKKAGFPEAIIQIFLDCTE